MMHYYCTINQLQWREHSIWAFLTWNPKAKQIFWILALLYVAMQLHRYPTQHSMQNLSDIIIIFDKIDVSPPKNYVPSSAK